ncbi:MAG TPA: GTPase [Acidimicrobiia bacterium]|nr:GTPase [Acidimicrobiia bacterium]
MRDLLHGLLEHADLALASCDGVLQASALAPLTDSIAAVRARLSYPDDVAVIALAGGTGSGKSSLFNAYIGEEGADVGGMRPTTSAPLAAVPTGRSDAMAGYLDRIGIEDRMTHSGKEICLIDLPDTDSVELDHRHQVDALLGVVDLVIWVVDPEKYRDARLHQDYLRPMAPYASQFLFVLNQIDRLQRDDLHAVETDLRAALVDDGINEPVLVAMAASPPAGPPIGLDALHSAIDSRLHAGGVVYDKLLTDLEATAQALADATGVGLDFDRRAGEAVDEAVVHLLAGEERAAGERLIDLLDSIASEVAGPSGGRIRALAADVPGHIARIASQVQSLQPTTWWRRLRGDADRAEPTARARSLVQQAVIRPARALLARRAVAVASVAELSLEVSRIRGMTDP